MKMPPSLAKKMNLREHSKAVRTLKENRDLIDFSSNDYLGFAKNKSIFSAAQQSVENLENKNGATGSRLLSGNYSLYTETENKIAKFHKAEKALIYNSGYDANIGLLSAILNRNDLVFYDEYSHASLRDGLTLSHAKTIKFKHNDLAHLERLLQKKKPTNGVVYVITESVFSMDGDSPNLKKLAVLAQKYNCYTILDEAHAFGVFGENGAGLASEYNLENAFFARIVTYGKAMGCHGAAILCNTDLYEYLVNFSRSLIYTTALPPVAVATINKSYEILKTDVVLQKQLHVNIKLFIGLMQVKNQKTISKSAIQTVVISGNEEVKEKATFLQNKGFDLKPILSPTVPEGEERLRICLHSYNTKTEIEQLVELLF